MIYAASFLDAEGCIVVYHRQETLENKGYFKLQVRVTQKYHIEPLEVFRDLWGGSIGRFGSGMFYWHAANRIAALSLEEMFPFLKVKREQAEEAIIFQKRRNKPGVRQSPDQKQMDLESTSKIKALKKVPIIS